MSNFNLYVHGVPVGHEIWGPAEDQDYIKAFYNNDDQEDVSSFLCVENVKNKTFYTYLRKKNVNNSDGRPGSFIGITVSFAGKFCKNTYTLFQLFEAIYEKGIVGNIIERSNGFERYKIRSFANEASSILNSIHKTFDTNLPNLGFQPAENLPKSNGFVRYNLKDVDSPVFFEESRTKKILISAEFPSKEEENRRISNSVAPLNKKCAELANSLSDSENKLSSALKSNNTLQQQIDSLNNKNKDLKEQLETVEKSLGKKYEQTINELEQKLRKKDEELKKQKESKEQDIKNAINSINEPIQKLARLMASRFPDTGSPNAGRGEATSRSSSASFDIKPWINAVLTLVLCGVVAFNTYRLSVLGEDIRKIENKTSHTEPQDSSTINPQVSADHQTSEEPSSQPPTEELSFRIDVSGNKFNKKAIFGEEYVISAKCAHENKHIYDECLKDCTVTYEVEGARLTENRFVVEDSATTKVIIKCTINGEKKTREIIVEK